jgi:dienelactone hydrolase
VLHANKAEKEEAQPQNKRGKESFLEVLAMKKILTIVIVMAMVFSLAVPAMAEDIPESTNEVAYFDVLRTSNNPGYYFSGALIDMGVTLPAGAVDKDTFSAKARVTEANGDIQGSFGNFGWDPDMEDRALEDNWAKWNILDAYISDADGNRVDNGNYVKIEIEYETRTLPSGDSDAERYDVPATRASWYTLGTGSWSTYHSFANIELIIDQEKTIEGIGTLTYSQNEIRHDPLFDAFDPSLEVPGGGRAPIYRPDNASEDNLRPLIVWFHGTGERYISMDINGATVDNPCANLVGNRALSFADGEFQSIMDGAYVLVPQSTTSGWNAGRLNDMEALINQVVAENHVDATRIYVGGLSMGTGMVTPLITSSTENKIDFAAAIQCSGGSVSAEQAQIIADKSLSVYFVGCESDFAAGSHPEALANLLEAGVDAKMKRYPEGPVFDGKHYYGAHDAWNYIYNNLVEDEGGETIFEWLAKQSTVKPLSVTTTANLLKKGDYFDVKVSFVKPTTSNAVSLVLNYDGDKFEYAGNLGEDSSQESYIDGVSYLTSGVGDGNVNFTIMIPDYNAQDLVSLRFRAKENADTQNADNSITATANYVYRASTGEKTVRTAFGSTDFTTSGNPGDTDGDGKITLIDLSNVIDMFGLTNGDELWIKAKFFDFNKNNVIDIADIVAVAKLII